MGVSLDTLIFISSFIKNVLLEDVRHVDLLFRMGDVKVTFGIVTCYFVQHPSYLLRCIPPFFTFIKFFIFFNSSLLQMYKCFLGLRSFNSLGPLNCKSLPLNNFRWCWVHIDIHHHPNNLFRELGPCCLNHSC